MTTSQTYHEDFSVWIRSSIYTTNLMKLHLFKPEGYVCFTYLNFKYGESHGASHNLSKVSSIRAINI